MNSTPMSARVRFWFGYWWPSCVLGWVARAFVRAGGEPGGVAVLLPEYIGDVVLTTPLLRALHARFPAAHIAVAVSPAAAPLLEVCPFVRQTIPWPQGLRAAVQVGHHLRSLRPDLVVVPRADPDQRWAPLVALLCGAPRRISLTDASSRLGRWKRLQSAPWFSETVRPRAGVEHERLRRLEIARALGLADAEATLACWVGAEDEARAHAFLAALPATGRRVAFGIGASARQRVWPAERFAQLIDQLARREAIVPILLRGPGEKDLADAIAARAGTRVFAMDDATLRETAALLRSCALFIGNDSAPMHLASAAGLPVVMISAHPTGAPRHHPNSPVKCGPSSPHVRVLQPPPASPACGRGCVSPTAHCILGVEVDAVARAAAELIASLPVAAGK